MNRRVAQCIEYCERSPVDRADSARLCESLLLVDAGSIHGNGLVLSCDLSCMLDDMMRIPVDQQQQHQMRGATHSVGPF